MQIKNNYDIYWEKKVTNLQNGNEEYETGNGVFNGEIGKITKINEKEKTLQIKFRIRSNRA